MFNATFNNISAISWWSVLLVEETGVPGEDHRPVARMYNALHTMISENKIITYVKSSYLVVREFEIETLIDILADTIEYTSYWICFRVKKRIVRNKPMGKGAKQLQRIYWCMYSG